MPDTASSKKLEDVLEINENRSSSEMHSTLALFSVYSYLVLPNHVCVMLRDGVMAGSLATPT